MPKTTLAEITARDKSRQALQVALRDAFAKTDDLEFTAIWRAMTAPSSIVSQSDATSALVQAVSDEYIHRARQKDKAKK